MENNKLNYISYLAFFTNGMMAVITANLINYIMGEYHFTYNQVAFFISLQSLGNLVMGLGSGILIRRFGKKLILITFPILFLAGCLGIAFFENYAILCLCMLLTGFGWGLCNNILHILMNEYENSDTKITILHTSYAAGSFAGPFILSQMLRLDISWKFSMYMISILSVILLIGFYRYKNNKGREKSTAGNVRRHENTESNRNRGFSTSVFFWRNPGYYVCMFLYFCYIGIEGAVNVWLVNYLYQSGRISLQSAQFMLSVFWMVIIIMRLFNIALLKKIRVHWILIIESFGIFVFTCSILFGSGGLIFLNVLLLGVFMGGISPCNAINASEFLHGNGFASGILFAFGGIGSMVVNMCVGAITQKFTVLYGMIFIAGLMALMFILSLINLKLDAQKTLEKTNINSEVKS